MGAADVREASARVIAALTAAGRSRATIKRHEAEFNAFAGFLEARGRALPAEVDCLDFVAERSGVRLAGLREATRSRRAQLARRPLVLLMEVLNGGIPEVGQVTTRRLSGARRGSGRSGTSTSRRAGVGGTLRLAS